MFSFALVGTKLHWIGHTDQSGGRGTGQSDVCRACDESDAIGRVSDDSLQSVLNDDEDPTAASD